MPQAAAGELGRAAVLVDPVGAPISLWWLVNFASSNVGATVKTALHLGATRAEVDCGAAVVLRDPAGALFGLVAAC